MTDAEPLRALDEQVLAQWLLEQRWFASKARELAQVHVLDVVGLGPSAGDGADRVAIALVEARFPGGTHDLYQLPLVLGRAGAPGLIGSVGGLRARDALVDPDAVAAIAMLLRERARVEGEHATIVFRWLDDATAPAPAPSVRGIGAEQSNSSVVLDETLVLKLYRRVEAGDNPELELLRFLGSHGYEHVAPLCGWIDYGGELMDATLAVVQRYLPGGRDGWDLVLDALVAGAPVEDELRALGAAVGRMHTVLGSDSSDPAFAPEEPSEESLALLTATVDEEIERAFVDLPSDETLVADIAGRGEEVRERLRLLSHVGARGRLIRQHGDLHLGQALRAERGWVVLDFEGEPARPLLERRRKRSPLRDVAGMLRSISYAASASELQRGVVPPEGWEERARAAFLDGYMDAVDPTLLPPGESQIATLLSIFELEKAVYELRYELNNRPDWVNIPAASIVRLLEAPLP